MATNRRNVILGCLSYYLFFISHSRSVTDTLLQGQQLRDYQQLVSADRIFNLGFFSPGPSKNRYLGVLRMSTSEFKEVWVANRDTPISDTSGVLEIDEFGNLTISDGGGGLTVLYSTRARAAGNASAVLLDNGNFVLWELNLNGSKQRVLWQSFDYPTDTLLPGMKLGINFKTGQTWSLTSWVSEEVPAKGSFTLGIDPNGTSKLVVWWQGNVFWTSGGLWQKYMDLQNFTYISNENEKYFTFGSTSMSILTLDYTGRLWDGIYYVAFCSGEKEISLSNGCEALKLPECRNPHSIFKRRTGYMDGPGAEFVGSNLSIFDCKRKCLNNCSCTAYSSFTGDGTGCQLWSRWNTFHKISGGSFTYILIRKEKRWWKWVIIGVLAAGVGATILLFLAFYVRRVRRLTRVRGKSKTEQEMLIYELEEPNKSKKLEKDGKNHELQFFSFESIESATNNFAATSKLGEGGFGPVYKGKLSNDQDVAVKRLSRNSEQGLVEFKNEVKLIAKLQHTNLVRLIGCCIQKEEKILIYEYMPNKSLDYFLFDPIKKGLLDWKKRFNIIEGIAQGLLYLHKYSRVRIIHRDLKAGNILLDDEMNPKISDFGMARIFGQNETKANTNRIVGTYGYMSPEYAMDGIFSTKSDVFSFGVLLLEIISGRKNSSFYHPENPLNVIGYAWGLWKEDRHLEIMDPALGNLHSVNEVVLRCTQVGLLCVEDNPTDRPSMSDVVSMVTNETMPLPAPKQPAYFGDRRLQERKTENCSLNKVSISEMEAR